MIIAGLFIGLVTIGMGFLAGWARKYPNLLAGYYSAMPKEKKKNIDFDGLSAFVKKGFIILGIILIVLSFILKIILSEKYFIFIITFAMITGTMIIMLQVRKYDHNAKENNNFNIFVYTYFVIISVVILLIFGTIAYISF